VFPVTAFGESLVDSLQQRFLTERLYDESGSARVNCAQAHRKVPMAGDKHNWQRTVEIRELLLQIQAGETRQLDIENQAPDAFARQALKELVCRSEQLDVVSTRSKQATEALPHRRIIIDNKHSGPGIAHGSDPPLLGRHFFHRVLRVLTIKLDAIAPDTVQMTPTWNNRTVCII